MTQLLPMLTDFAAGLPTLLRRPFQIRRFWRTARAGTERRATPSIYEIRARITQIDRAIISTYYESGVPAPRGTVYSGMQSLEKPWQPLPTELEAKLSILPARYVRALAVDDVLLIDTASGRIIDVMRQVHRRLQPCRRKKQRN